MEWPTRHVASAELYDAAGLDGPAPRRGTQRHTATLLPNGKVLAARYNIAAQTSTTDYGTGRPPASKEPSQTATLLLMEGARRRRV